MSAKRTTAPWLETVVTAALLYGVATHADSQTADSQPSVSTSVNLPSQPVAALAGN